MNEQTGVPLPEHQPDVAEVDNGWSFTKIWNDSIEKPDDREYEARDYMWASELGKLYTDVYLKMQGTKQTNPPNARSFRKFEAGNLWEWLVMMILRRSGLLIEDQRRIKVGYPGLIEVSGKMDFYAGGTPDYDKAAEDIAGLYLPPKTEQMMKNVIEHLRKSYPDGLEPKALEIKSVSSFMMNALEITKKPLAIHALQAYHYTKDEIIDRADVVYICRDDCRMMEFPIFAGNPEYEKMYVDYVTQMTEYYKAGVMPPKAEPIVFDESAGKFQPNRQIGWSPYLTLVYELEDQMEFDEKYGKIPAGWNAVLKRIKEEKKMTPLNLTRIEEMKEWGFDAHKCAEMYILPKADDEAEDKD